MKTSCTPAPVWLNGWKHHLEFVCSEILSFQNIDAEGFKALYLKLKIMGASISDFYIGKLSTSEIADEICVQLKTRNVFDFPTYLKWINASEKKYREVSLSDKSVWTLVECDNPEFYVHIHPSRYSPHAFRVKGNILRTAVALLAYLKFSAKAGYEIETINLVRKEYLHMSPIDERHIAGILKTLEFLEQRCKNL